jgi:hypothetical protein
MGGISLLPRKKSAKSRRRRKLLEILILDEGITGYRDDSLETVKRNRDQYAIPLKILSYEELYGWTMDRIGECQVESGHEMQICEELIDCHGIKQKIG